MSLRRVAAVGGGLLTGLAMLNWPALLTLLAVSGMTVVATCWVVSDPDRPKRLALLIRTWRANPARPLAARSAPPRSSAVVPARKAGRVPNGR
jgi:hypothetical protein